MIKKIAIAVATIAFVASGMAQGVFVNNNRVTTSGIDAPVYRSDGTTGLDSGFVTQVWGGASEGALAPISGISPFRDGNGAGYWNSPVAERTEGVAVAGVAAGESAFLQVWAWDASYADLDAAVASGAVDSYGFSTVFSAVAGSPALAGPPAVPAAPAVMAGLTSFNLVPEPTTIALGLMGLGLIALRSRKS